MTSASPGTGKASSKGSRTPASIKNRVALSSVFAAVALTGMKLAVGLMTGSLGILSEAAHSALDLGAAFMTLVAVRIAEIPADDTHHYGHGKVEGLSALFEVMLLMITCGYIIYEATHRIVGGAPPIEVNAWSFAVMGISIVVDISRSTALYRTAKKYKSQALEADALHFSSDIFSSLVVIAGLIGYRFLDFPLADSVAALLVAVLVIVVSVRLAVRTVGVLVDRAPQGQRREIEKAILTMEQVTSVDSLRVRTSGSKTFIDMRIKIRGDLSFTQAHGVANAVEDTVRELIPDADVMVHADPCDSDVRDESFREIRVNISKLLKEHRSMIEGYHNMRVFRRGDRYTVSLHIEMKGDTVLADAHAVCDHLERDIKRSLHGAEVTIHVEPCRKG